MQVECGPRVPGSNVPSVAMAMSEHPGSIDQGSEEPEHCVCLKEDHPKKGANSTNQQNT